MATEKIEDTDNLTRYTPPMSFRTTVYPAPTVPDSSSAAGVRPCLLRGLKEKNVKRLESTYQR